MRIKQLPTDFVVEEHLQLPGEKGAYAYYRVEKEARSTRSVRDAMAAGLKVTPSALVFPAAKDKHAVTIQYASVRKRGPEELSGDGYAARRVGWGPRALRSADIEGNRFTLVVRDLSQAEAQGLAPAMERLALHGLPNYFDDRRFGSLSKEGFIGKEILKRDPERVVYIYLAVPMRSDRRDVREFKRLVAGHWGQWGYLLHQAPRPSNYRSVITHLKDHPHDYRKAVNLIKDQLLAVYLAGYQAWIWNRVVGEYLRRQFEVPYVVRIARRRFPLPEPGPGLGPLQETMVELPRLTARYEGDLAPAAQAVFAAEGLTIRDFKTRILRRVYLVKGEREVAFAPGGVEVTAPTEDEENPGRRQVTVTLTLALDRYATLVLKAGAAMVGAEIRLR